MLMKRKIPYMLIALALLALVILAPHRVYRLWQNGIMAWPWGGYRAARAVSNWLEGRL